MAPERDPSVKAPTRLRCVLSSLDLDSLKEIWPGWGTTAEYLARSATVRLGLRVWSWVVLAALVGLLLLVAAATVPVLFGYHTYIVRGGSMEPALRLGSVAVTGSTNPLDLAVGDVIAWRASSDSPPVLHRIVEITSVDGERRFVTQGDANASQDPEPVALQGPGDKVVYAVPYAGYILEYSRSVLGHVLLIGIPLALLGPMFLLGRWRWPRLGRGFRSLNGNHEQPSCHGSANDARGTEGCREGTGAPVAPGTFTVRRAIVSLHVATGPTRVEQGRRLRGGPLGRALHCKGVSMRSHRIWLFLLSIALALSSAICSTGALAVLTDGGAVTNNTLTADALDPPTSPGATGGCGIRLNWTASVDGYASGHRVLRSTGSGGPYTQIAEVTPRATTTYWDYPAAGTYYYLLRAFYHNWESTSSNETSGTSSPAPWLKTGSYTGNGTDNRAITGVGFQPDVVFVKCDCGQMAAVRTSTMAGDATKVISNTGTLQADHVQSLDADGFTIGASSRVNMAGATYYWVAMKAGTYLSVGSYVGDGTDNRSIGGIAFQPVWVMTMGDGDESWFRPSTLAGDASYRVEGLDSFTNRIQAIEPNGFQIGSNVNVNELGTTFHYIAWRGAAGIVTDSTYVGDGTDNRSVTGVGFPPQFAWVKRNDNSASTWHPASISGDLSLLWDAAAAANNIQMIEADGFQLGTHTRVNTSGQTYHYLALRDCGP